MSQRRCCAKDSGRGPSRRVGCDAFRAGPPRRLDPAGEVRQHRRLEELAQRHLDAESFPQARQHLRREQTNGRPGRRSDRLPQSVRCRADRPRSPRRSPRPACAARGSFLRRAGARGRAGLCGPPCRSGSGEGRQGPQGRQGPCSPGALRAGPGAALRPRLRRQRRQPAGFPEPPPRLGAHRARRRAPLRSRPARCGSRGSSPGGRAAPGTPGCHPAGSAPGRRCGRGGPPARDQE